MSRRDKLTAARRVVKELEIEAAKARYHEFSRIVAAYLLDRADQYETRSPCWIALSDAAMGVMKGEPIAANEHGEYDAELLKRVNGIRGKAPPVEPTLGTDDDGDS